MATSLGGGQFWIQTRPVKGWVLKGYSCSDTLHESYPHDQTKLWDKYFFLFPNTMWSGIVIHEHGKWSQWVMLKLKYANSFVLFIVLLRAEIAWLGSSSYHYWATTKWHLFLMWLYAVNLALLLVTCKRKQFSSDQWILITYFLTLNMHYVTRHCYPWNGIWYQ